MPTVRKRRSRKNARINTTRYGSRLKKKSSNKIKAKIQIECIRRRWDTKKTLKQNLMELGLSVDPNKSVPVRRQTEDVNKMDVSDQSPNPQPTPSHNNLIAELEAIASDVPSSKPFLMSPGEAKFIAYLIARHGMSYKKMVRDKKNYNQLTEGQLKKKCLQFHKSPYVYLLEPDD